MSSSSASANRTCPVCGARNSGISLFCAECGSSLNAGIPRSGDTTALPTRSTASQHTEPFIPATNGSSGRRRGSLGTDQDQDHHPDETAPFRPLTGVTDTTTGSRNPWSSRVVRSSSGATLDDRELPEQVPPRIVMEENHDRGVRGFVLGLLAFALIGGVLGLYGWTAWLGPDLRDTISGWFAFIG